MATINGSGPNMVLAGVYSKKFPRAPPVTFLQWMLFALPLTVPFLICEWLLLCLLLCPSSAIPIVEAAAAWWKRNSKAWVVTQKLLPQNSLPHFFFFSSSL
jgi:di/tricarboxylate transporter